MKKENKFSIIIPMYNVEKYIYKCIDSILSQNYVNYEIIIVDDGSNDESAEIVKKINDNRIKLIQKENGGLSSARNEGVKYSNGDYIWFVDADDYIEPNALEIVNNKIKNIRYDVICFEYYKDYGQKKELFKDKINLESKQEYPLINTSACSKIFNKDFYINNKFEFPLGKIYEDLALIPYVMVKANNVLNIKEPLYNYVYRDGSIMNQKKEFKKNRDDKFDVLDILFDYFKVDGIEKKYESELEYLVIRHLLVTYSTEILPFSKKVYQVRCKKVLKYLKQLNKKWYKNKYLKNTALTTRLYVHFFRFNLFYICKLFLRFR